MDSHHTQPARDPQPASPDAQVLIVVAKQPEPGRVKTRIAATLGDDTAARLYACALADTLDLVRAVHVSPALSYAPPTDEARAHFADLAPDFTLVPQLGEDFGTRLLGAFRAAFALGAHQVVLIGTDNPSLPTGYVRQAFAALEDAGTDVVLGPVTDGGYYLLGMKRPHPILFERVAWSTEVVAEQTRERAREGGLRLAEVPTWYDLDVEDDLRTLLQDVRGTGDGRAPRTRALIEQLGLQPGTGAQ